MSEDDAGGGVRRSVFVLCIQYAHCSYEPHNHDTQNTSPDCASEYSVLRMRDELNAAKFLGSIGLGQESKNPVPTKLIRTPRLGHIAISPARWMRNGSPRGMAKRTPRATKTGMGWRRWGNLQSRNPGQYYLVWQIIVDGTQTSRNGGPGHTCFFRPDVHFRRYGPPASDATCRRYRQSALSSMSTRVPDAKQLRWRLWFCWNQPSGVG